MLLSAMVILPQSAKADDFTPDMFPGQSPDRTAFEVWATVKVGAFGKCPNTKSYVTAISSTDQSVVRTYNENGYSAVLIVGVGTADVTYTETGFSEGDNGVINLDGPSTNHIIHYTVEQAVPTAQWVQGDEPITKARLIWYPDGSHNFYAPDPDIRVMDVGMNAYNQPYMRESRIGFQQIEYSSSNTDVATVSPRGVTPVSYGKTTITATWPGTVNWKGVSISYELTVEEPKQSVYINFYQTEITGFAGEQMTAPMNVQMLTIDRWLSEKPEVASVDEKTGTVKFHTVGTTRIYAQIDETDEHYAAQGYYTVTVKKRTPELSFSEQIAYGEPNVPFTAPTLINPSNVPIDKWYSSNPNVAEVNEATGEVTIKGVGDVSIFCEFTGNDIYEGATASYIIHSATIGLQVMGIEVTSLNADDVLGDGSKKVTFDKASRKLNLNGWVLDASGIGDPNIRTHVIWNHSKEPLTINPTGECAIRNADACVVSMSGALVFMSDSKDGTLTMTANETTQSIAVQASAVKVHECDVTAIGSVVGMKIGELTVSSSAHVYAEATGEKGFAIQCSEFVKGDENVGILTPGVLYDESVHQFFSDEAKKVQAMVVEIGKVLVTVPDDEETSIEFNVTDASDHSAVVFSASANDSYNEETGQLEISTSLTDEQVAAALETLIPGSSAWVSMLPGSLTFDIPAGKGSILVNCMTLPGYTLNMMIEGQGTVSITQASLGWAKVTYYVAEPTHVVIFLHASSSSAPTRRAQAMAGAYISAVKIIPENAPNAIDFVKSAKSLDNGKYLQNGQLYIVRDARVYNVQGIEVK